MTSLSLQYILIVYKLKSVEAIKMKLVAPMPEQIATSTTQFLKDTNRAMSLWTPQTECCSGMGATNLIFKVHTYFISVTKTYIALFQWTNWKKIQSWRASIRCQQKA